MENDATSYLYFTFCQCLHGAAAAVRTLLMSLYDNDIDKLKQWNQADQQRCGKGKAKDLTTKFLLW